MSNDIAIVHDYLTQRGGAERVVLALADAFPEAPIHTSLYAPNETFPAFDESRVQPMMLNEVETLREDHRRALPLLAPGFSALNVDADVALCSSSGWAHGVRTSGCKIVYCHTPARWLYQSDRYLREHGPAAHAAVALLGPLLRSWDRRRADTADRYIANSRVVRDRVRRQYGIDPEVVPPPHSMDPEAPRQAIDGVEPGFWLTVARLLPYKNVDVIVEAFDRLENRRLVVVGKGPQLCELRSRAPDNIRFTGWVTDGQLRWLYANCVATVAASFEDYGLTPLEAAAFGKPTVAVSWGGYLDTIVDGRTGILVDRPRPECLVGGVERLESLDPPGTVLKEHAADFSRQAFIGRLRDLVGEAIEEEPSQDGKGAPSRR